MKDIKDILRHYSLLQENVRQAEKLLNQAQIPLDNPIYLNLRKQLEQNNSLGLLGPIVKLSKDNQGQLNTIKMERVYDYIIQNKALLSKLQKPLHSYDNTQDLVRDVGQIEVDYYRQKILKELSNPQLRKYLAMAELSAHHPNFATIKRFVNNLTSEQQRGFWVNSARYKTLEEVYTSMKNYMAQIGEKFYYDVKLKDAQAMGQEHVEILHNDPENQLLLLEIKTFEASKKLGLTVWCIVRQVEEFAAHTRSGDYGQYFFYDFRPQTPFKQQALAFTLTPGGKITESMDRHNEPFEGILGYLQKLGVDTQKLSVPETADPYYDEYFMQESILRQLRNIIK